LIDLKVAKGSSVAFDGALARLNWDERRMKTDGKG